MPIKSIILCLLLSTTIFAQSDTNTTVRDLDLRIIAPKLDTNLPHSIQSKLERKIIAIFTQNDIVNSQESTFAIHPYLSLIEFGKLEGLTTEETVRLEFHLLVKNQFSDQVFLTFSQKISGSGKTKNAAINRALSSIRPQQIAYSNFINDLQTKVTNYYNSECQNIITDAQQAVSNNEFEKAIALLNALPESSDCKAANQSFLNQTYTQYQIQNCQSFLSKAEVAMLKKNYKEAINLLGQIDPNSPCKEEAKQLLQSVSAKVDEQTAKKMEFLNKVYEDNVEIGKVRQQCMKSISNTYIEGIKKDN